MHFCCHVRQIQLIHACTWVPAIKTVAASHRVSAAQIALRFVTQLGGGPVAVSPGLDESYAVEDLGLGGFTLTAKEMATLAAI